MDPESLKAAGRKYRKSGKGRASTQGINRRALLKRQYNLTPEEYDRLLVSQGGVCAICGLPETVVRHGKVQSLSVDHDHITKQVRGLLCNGCNRAIGYLRDNAPLLRMAADYLDRARNNGGTTPNLDRP